MKGKNSWRIALVSALAALLGGCEKPPEMTPVPTGAGAACADLTYAGFPRQEKTKLATRFLCRDGVYALNFEVSTRTAQWVVEHLRATDLDQRDAVRQEDFRPDPDMGMWSPRLEDYRDSGWDRGHLAPADDYREDPVKMSQSFYLTNIVPQNAIMNRGVWGQLEKVTRALAKTRGEVWVTTGPVFYQGQIMGHVGLAKDSKPPPPLTRDSQLRMARPVSIPTHLYKVIVDPKAGQAWAFIVPNAGVTAPITKYRVPVAVVEAATGLRFFPDLPLDQQARLKTVQADLRLPQQVAE